MLICFGCRKPISDPERVAQHRPACRALADVTVAKVVRMSPRAAWE